MCQGEYVTVLFIRGQRKMLGRSSNELAPLDPLVADGQGAQ